MPAKKKIIKKAKPVAAKKAAPAPVVKKKEVKEVKKDTKPAKVLKAKREPIVVNPIPKPPKFKGFKNFFKKYEVGAHLTVAGSAMVVLLLMSAFDSSKFATLLSFASVSQQTTVSETIGLEYTKPATVTMMIARKSGAGLVTITNTSDSAIKMSLPQHWGRMEVKGGLLSDVIAELPSFGYVRWTIPGNVTVTYSASEVPTTINFESPSSMTAAIHLTTVDLPSNDAQSKVVLLQKKASVQLWGKSE